jgi:hypothetical protein
MYQDDDRLQDALQHYEESGNLEGDAKEPIPGSDELSSLVYLAASIRELPHPVQSGSTAKQEKRRIVAAAEVKKQKQHNPSRSRNGGFTGQWIVLPAVAGAALLILMVFVLAAGAGIYFSGPRGANAASLSAGSGVVEVFEGEGSWVAIADGQRVNSGARLRTGADSTVTLTFFDGTQVTLEPNTDLVLSEVAGDWGKKLQVAMIQNEGETTHQVVPLQGETSNYSVVTPSGEASVRGTSFKVLVEDSGNSVFSVDSGAVLVSNNDEQLLLAAGQGMLTELGQPLPAPAYLFALQGELQDKSGKTWLVEGVPVTVKGGTRISGDPQVGDIVLVNGRITRKNEWLADSIQAPLPGEKGGTFSGVVTAVSEGAVEINGYPFLIVDEQPEVAVGDWVRVQFLIVDGTWQVVTLSLLDGSDAGDPDPEPEPEPEPSPEPQAALYFDPEENTVSTCEAIGPVATKLYYQNDDQAAEPLNVSLVLTVLSGEQFINPPTFSPEGAFEITPGGEVGVDVNVELIDSLEALPPGAEVEIRLTLVDESTEETIGDSFYLKWECDEDLEDDEDGDDDGDGDKCTREKQHPHALTLEAVYGEAVGVDYDQIWSWFCEDNLGFGEIELAFKLYLQYAEVFGEEFTVYQIIDMRLLGGLGWGQIKQSLAQDAKDLLSPEDSGKKVPPGKDKSEEAKNKEKPNKKDN